MPRLPSLVGRTVARSLLAIALLAAGAAPAWARESPPADPRAVAASRIGPSRSAAEARGRQSPYYDWYERDRAGHAVHYFDWTNLPNLNYDNPAVREMIASAFIHWARDFNIDGFRIDAAWGVRDRRPDFYPLLRRR